AIGQVGIALKGVLKRLGAALERAVQLGVALHPVGLRAIDVARSGELTLHVAAADSGQVVHGDGLLGADAGGSPIETVLGADLVGATYEEGGRYDEEGKESHPGWWTSLTFLAIRTRSVNAPGSREHWTSMPKRFWCWTLAGNTPS